MIDADGAKEKMKPQNKMLQFHQCGLQ